MEYARWFPRTVGFLIDGAITAWPALLVGLLDRWLHLSPVFIVLAVLLSVELMVYNRWVRSGKTGQTFGRQRVGIRLVSQRTGQPIGPGFAFLRDVCHVLDYLSLYVGWLFPLWDHNRQTFADKIMKTVVVV